MSASSGAYSAVVALGTGIEAHGSQRLVGVLAGGDGLGVANGNLTVQIRDVGDGLDLSIGALGANDHEVVDEHVLTRVGIDELGGFGVVHGALGGRDEHVDGGTGAHLLDKVARRLKLRVGKRGAGLLGVELLNLGQSFLERVSGKDLQLDSLLLRGRLDGAGIGSGRLGRLAARTAGKTKAGSGDSRKRNESAARNHIEHVTLSNAMPGYPTAGFNLQSDYTSARIMIVRNLFSSENIVPNYRASRVASAENKGGAAVQVAPPQLNRLVGMSAASCHLSRMGSSWSAMASQLSRAAFVEPGKFTTSV